jgi:hypothetical protein
MNAERRSSYLVKSHHRSVPGLVGTRLRTKSGWRDIVQKYNHTKPKRHAPALNKYAQEVFFENPKKGLPSTSLPSYGTGWWLIILPHSTRLLDIPSSLCYYTIKGVTY